MQPSINEIKTHGVAIRTEATDVIINDGQQFPKFQYYLYKDEEWAVPTPEYLAYIEKKDKEKQAREAVEARTLNDYRGEDKNGNIARCRRFVEEFESKYCRYSLYIWSRFNSTQKTTVARALIKELKDRYKRVNCRFVLANSLMSDLKNAEFTPEAQTRVEGYRAADFLVIDDAFTGDKVTKYSSGFQTSFLDTFLRERLEVSRLATCFTSNIPIDEIGKYWGASIEALIRRTTFPMEFNDVLGKDTDFDISHIFD